MARYFRNPQNDYVEKLDWTFWGTVLFGPIFFGLRGAFGHAFFSAIAAIFTLGISWLVYPFLAQGLLASQYLQKGWEEISEEQALRPKESYANSTSWVNDLFGFLMLGLWGLLIWFAIEGFLAWYYALLIGFFAPVVIFGFVAAISDDADDKEGYSDFAIFFILLILGIVFSIEFFTNAIFQSREFWQLFISAAVTAAVTFAAPFFAWLAVRPDVKVRTSGKGYAFLLAINLALLSQIPVLVFAGVIGIPSFIEYSIVELAWWILPVALVTFPGLIILLAFTEEFFGFFPAPVKTRELKAEISDELKEKILGSLEDSYTDLKILVAFARADGRMVKEERNIIVEYFSEIISGVVSNEDMDEFVKRTKVSKTALTKAIGSILEDERRAKKVLACAEKLREKDRSTDGTFQDLWVKLSEVR